MEEINVDKIRTRATELIIRWSSKREYRVKGARGGDVLPQAVSSLVSYIPYVLLILQASFYFLGARYYWSGLKKMKEEGLIPNNEINEEDCEKDIKEIEEVVTPLNDPQDLPKVLAEKVVTVLKKYRSATKNVEEEVERELINFVISEELNTRKKPRLNQASQRR